MSVRVSRTLRRTGLLGVPLLLAASLAQGDSNRLPGDLVQCANLIYAGTKTSRCFSDRFLQRVSLETNIDTDGKFTPVKLGSQDIYQHPFAVMTGEGTFALTDAERVNLKNYLTRGGFLLASAGCSDPGWAAAFRREMGRVFPDRKLETLPMTHAVFHTVYDIDSVKTSHGAFKAKLEGLTIGERLAVVFSQDGLNDTEHAQNCCCCGGDEIVNAEFINVNVLAYALLH